MPFGPLISLHFTNIQIGVINGSFGNIFDIPLFTQYHFSAVSLSLGNFTCILFNYLLLPYEVHILYTPLNGNYPQLVIVVGGGGVIID